MTPEQEALVEKMLDLFVRKVPVKKSLCLAEAGLVSHRRLSEEEERAALDGKITPHVLTNVGMFELLPTDAGKLVLALAAERDLWRLKAEWQERAAYYYRTGIGHDAMIRAKSAYVAAGGVVLWRTN